jgi:hypothetical protein
MNYARRLVFVRITKGEGRDMWLMSPHWRERLNLVGIDPVTFTITDQNRFNLAWIQIATTKTFHISQQRVDINRGKVAPSPQAIERHWIQKPKDKLSKPQAFSSHDENVPANENPYAAACHRARRRILTRSEATPEPEPDPLPAPGDPNPPNSGPELMMPWDPRLSRAHR